MSYGVEIFNEFNQTRLDASTSTALLVAIGTVFYSGNSSTIISIPAVNGSGTSYGMASFKSTSYSEYATITMPTQTSLKIDWWAGASSSDFIVYAVYHR